jgi:hypothetical protein
MHIFNAWKALPHVMWDSYHHGMARPQVADGEDGLQIWRVKGKGKVVPVL